MEITKLSIISDFVSPILPKVPQVYNNFWKWCAIILAVIATFTSIFTRIKLLIIRVRSIKRSSSSKHLLQHLDDDFDFTDDDDTPSSVSESDDEDLFDSTSSFDGQNQNQNQNQFDQDFRVAGSNSSYGDNQSKNTNNSNLRRRRSGCDLFSWSDFAAGKSVVKLWDSLGLGLDFQDSFASEISIWDLDKDHKISSFLGGKHRIPAMEMSSPAVVYLAEMSNSDHVLLGAYDRRMGSKNPTVYAEWGPPLRKVFGVSSGGVEKVYVEGGGAATGALTVGDLRNVRTPLGSLTESDADTWWDADTVINHDEF